MSQGLKDNQIQAQVVAPGSNQTASDPLFEKRVLALQQRERELTKREAALKDAFSLDQLKDMARKDRKGLFDKLGIDPSAPDEDPNDPMVAMRREIQELKAQKEAEQRAKEDRDFADSVRSKLSEKSENYELIDKLGAYDELINYLRNNKAEDGSSLDVYQIADVLEQNLYQKLEPVKTAKKLAPWFEKSSQTESPAPYKTNHPLDSKQTMTSLDRGITEKAPERPVDRFEALQKAAQHLVFTNTQGN